MMRKTKVWAWLTMLCMFFVMAVAVACTNGNKDDSSSSAVAEITLDKTTLELDLHESMQLTATKKNTEAEIVRGAALTAQIIEKLRGFANR